MIGTQNPLVALAGLLVELQRDSHLAGRVVRGRQADASRDRVQMIGTENPLPVGKNPLELRNGVLVAALSQVGLG